MAENDRSIKMIQNLKFVNKYQVEKDKLIENAPYHLNIIDEVHADENAHSRILVKILQYQEVNQYSNLISFLKYLDIGENPTNPKIHAEKNRIDATIIDDNYAVIIENKIHNAVDQDEQLKRYVDVVQLKGKALNKIHVLYLTRCGEKKPTKSSFPDYLRDKLGPRYKGISFRHHILPWLEEAVLPKCRLKDRELISGIEQYVDHLKGMFNLRKGFEVMNTQLDELLKKELLLTDDVRNNYIIVKNRVADMNSCISNLNSLRDSLKVNLRKEFLKKLYDKLIEDDTGWQCVSAVHKEVNVEDTSAMRFGFKNENYKYYGLFFSIEIQNRERFLCGIFSEISDAKKAVKREIQSKFKEKGVTMTFNDSNWVYLNLEAYVIGDCKPAENIYDDKWDEIFTVNVDGVVNVFYKNISKVFIAWKEICTENKTIDK